MLRFRPEKPEKRRSEKHTREHFCHHLWLSETPGDRSYKTAEEKNDRQLEEELNG